MSQDVTAPAVRYEPVKDFPGYRVGTDGSVWTCWQRISHGRPNGTSVILSSVWRLMKPRIRNGYPAVGLSRNGKRREFSVHRLILEAFAGPCPQGMEGAHENGIKTDCRADNLKWKTKPDNNADKKRHGTWQGGEKHGLAKITEEICFDIFARRAKGESYRVIGNAVGLSKGYVHAIDKGRAWKHLPRPAG